MSDEELVRECLQQKASAQKAFYHRFSRKLWRLCLRYAGTREEAEDLMQEGFLKVFQSLPEFRMGGSLEGWVRKIILNTVFDILRRKKKVELSDEWEEEVDQGAEDVIEKLKAEDVINQIQRLKPEHRIIFNLHALEGFSHGEIAKMLEMNENTIKSQYARARRILAEQCRDYYERHYKRNVNREETSAS